MNLSRREFHKRCDALPKDEYGRSYGYIYYRYTRRFNLPTRARVWQRIVGRKLLQVSIDPLIGFEPIKLLIGAHQIFNTAEECIAAQSENQIDENKKEKAILEGGKAGTQTGPALATIETTDGSDPNRDAQEHDG